ncbi:MAG: phosphoribosylanthranilate isomerase [Desulfobacterales bacterium]|jgi:phosphoribosylanthranilate isomerase|nr:phosphoribosylanthranilate isomerase [Desulfobacterales bacterium]
MTKRIFPQIKICGLTTVDAAVQCADLGVHAIGCVFFAKSPRHLSDKMAEKICCAVRHRVETVGVFVNESLDTILQKIRDCRLSAVQLHGTESADLVQQLRDAGVPVIKALFVDGEPNLNAAGDYDPSAFLVECGKGPLPGGNAETWDWGRVKDFSTRFPCILAGGLTPDNVVEAIQRAMPSAIDVSSGVESAPGRKDLKKVELLLTRVSGIDLSPGKQKGYPIFHSAA